MTNLPTHLQNHSFYSITLSSSHCSLVQLSSFWLRPDLLRTVLSSLRRLGGSCPPPVPSLAFFCRARPGGIAPVKGNGALGAPVGDKSCFDSSCCTLAAVILVGLRLVTGWWPPTAGIRGLEFGCCVLPPTILFLGSGRLGRTPSVFRAGSVWIFPPNSILLVNSDWFVSLAAVLCLGWVWFVPWAAIWAPTPGASFCFSDFAMRAALRWWMVSIGRFGFVSPR